MMKNRIFIVLLGLLPSWLGMGGGWVLPAFAWDGAATIAYVGSGDADGKRALDAIRMYLDEVESRGGINGMPVELLVFEDHNREDSAKKIAEQIAASQNILLVLGHIQDKTSLAAAQIYERHQIPALTASATSDKLTTNRRWYFGIIPSDGVRMRFAVSYMRRVLNVSSAAIIYSDTPGGPDMAERFIREGNRHGIDTGKIKFSDTIDAHTEAQRIGNRLLASELQPQMVLLALPPTEAAFVVAQFKDAGLNIPLIVQDTLPTGMMKDRLEARKAEGLPEGYYVDGLYGITPYLDEVANEQALEFEKRYMARFHDKPGWIGAYYHDAIRVAVEALKKCDLKGTGHILQDRRGLRHALAGFFDLANSVRGVTGANYFNAEQRAIKPLVMGVYHGNRLWPAWAQYKQLSDFADIDDTFHKALSGELLLLDGRLMSYAQVVYTDMKINEIGNFAPGSSEVLADFTLTFRYRGDFDPAGILFKHALFPVSFKNEEKEEKSDEITVLPITVRTQFNPVIDYRAYPFDRRVVDLRFHHGRLTSDNLIFVPGEELFSANSSSQNGGPKLPEGWRMERMSVSRDVLTKRITMGRHHFSDNNQRLYHDLFKTLVHLRRDNLALAIWIFGPILILAGALFAGFYLPHDRLATRMGICMLVLAVTAALHLSLLTHFPAGNRPSVEYLYFMIQALVLVSISAFIILYKCRREKAEKAITIIAPVARIMFGAVAFLFIIFYLKITF